LNSERTSGQRLFLKDIIRLGRRVRIAELKLLAWRNVGGITLGFGIKRGLNE